LKITPLSFGYFKSLGFENYAQTFTLGRETQDKFIEELKIALFLTGSRNIGKVKGKYRLKE